MVVSEMTLLFPGSCEKELCQSRRPQAFITALKSMIGKEPPKKLAITHGEAEEE
jgi:hypothetical protein